MALQSIANGMGMPLDAIMMFSDNGFLGTTMDAAGESCAFIGKIYIEGAAASKTISSAGGKIVFRTGTVTFANAGTNFRVGIQDVAATGLEDGTWDVQANLTGGGGGLASNTWYELAMSSGSKTINHLDTVAIVFETTSRGGADSIIVQSYSFRNLTSSNSNFPYRTADSGSGPARQTQGNIGACIIFDDGTLGWFHGLGPYIPGSQNQSVQSYNVSTTPDEYGAVFQVPFKCAISGAYLSVGGIASTDNFEIVLYSDAQGTPVAERTVTVDPNLTGSVAATAPYLVTFSSYTLSPGLWYGLSMRPTTANNLSIGYIDIGASFGNKYKKMLPFGTNCKFSSRTNQSGAFSEVQSYFQPIFGLWVDKLDDGVGGGVTSSIYLS